MEEIKPRWMVDYSNSAKKSKKALPSKIRALMDTLAKEIEIGGPKRADWPNYSPLKKTKGIPEDSYHCHIKNGRPTYVACWTVMDKKVKFVEIFYVGTHEKAPY